MFSFIFSLLWLLWQVLYSVHTMLSKKETVSMVDERTHTDRLLLHLCSLTKKYPYVWILIFHVYRRPPLVWSSSSWIFSDPVVYSSTFIESGAIEAWRHMSPLFLDLEARSVYDYFRFIHRSVDLTTAKFHNPHRWLDLPRTLLGELRLRSIPQTLRGDGEGQSVHPQ